MRPPTKDFDVSDLQTFAITEVLAIDSAGELPLTCTLQDTTPEESEEARNEARILIFGTTRKGHSVALNCRGQQPTLIFEFFSHYDALDSFLKADASTRRRSEYKLRIKRLKRFQGQVPSKSNPLERELFDQYHVSLDSLQEYNQLKRRLSLQFKDSIQFVNESLKMSTAFCNEQGLVMSSWASLDPISILETRVRDCDSGWSTCQVEVDVDLTKKPSLSAVEINDVPPWIACSFDCEMMSQDGLFPMTTKGDHTVALCATVWNVKEGPSRCERHAFVLVDKLKGPLNEQGLRKECNFDTIWTAISSQDLLRQFRKFIVDYDVDLLTGWNIYGFDMPFLWNDLQNQFVDHFLLRASQSIAIEASKAVGQPMPNSDELLQQLRSEGQSKAAKNALAELWRKQPTLPKNAADWPEKIARPFRKQLYELLGQSEIKVPVVSSSTVSSWPDGPLKDICSHLCFDRSSDDLSSQQWGRIRTESSKLELRNMSSAAKGDNTYSIWTATGRITVDLMQIIKDDKKPESNSLRFAAETWLDKDQLKKDLEASEMFAAQASGNPHDLEVLLDQCIRDAEIPMLLIDKLSYMSTWIEMSRVTFTSLSQVLNGGQQRKVFNVIARFVHNEQAINIEDSGWPDAPDDDSEASEDPLAKRKPDYQGATVIEPDPGHYETPVSVLDFESLQPSIIIFFNLCASNLLLGYSETDLCKLKEECPGFDQETHIIEHNILEDPVAMTYRTEFRKQTFVKHSAGVLPRLLRHLLKSRKAVKALMAAETDPFQKNVLNGRQNGLKIVCNSVYGFCGVRPSKGLLSCKPVAAVTTLKGRSFIDAAKKFVEDHYKAHVLYGDTDSIMILWPRKEDASVLTIPEAFALGEEASKLVTELLRSGSALNVTRPALEEARTAVTLANEKVQCPYLLLKKKNQAGLKWTPSKKVTKVAGFGYELDMKGIDAVRRDRTKFVRELSETVLQQLLIENDPRKSIECLTMKIQDLVLNRVSIDDFVLSKSLKGTYANNNVPHVQAWLRMKERGDSGCPEKGGRMPIVMVEPYGPFAKMNRKKVPLQQRCEHPEFVKKTPGIQLSRSQYLDGLAETFDRLYKPTKYHKEVLDVFAAASEQVEHLDSRNLSLSSFFSTETPVSTESFEHLHKERPTKKAKVDIAKKKDSSKKDTAKSLSLMSFMK